MGNYEKGVLGAFSGLVGTVVGATYRTIEVMKSRPKKSTKPARQSQIEQRFKFGLMTRFLSRGRELINKGFKPTSKLLSPMNAAVQYNLLRAITGTTPEFEIDYSKIRLSNGPLKAVQDVVISVNATGRLVITWSTAYADLYKPLEKPIRDIDTARVYVYSEDSDYSLTGGYDATRLAGTVVVPLPSEAPGERMHVWLFFVSADETQTSTSRYLGSVLSTD